MKAMDHWFGTDDLRVGFYSGAICGLLKMLDIYLLTDVYAMVLLKVFITGIIGGIGGVIGKHIFSYLKKKYIEKFKKKT